jgi:NAD(P)-dependent dehydrogenase (short-subunit alcohol dehydrogenase family)
MRPRFCHRQPGTVWAGENKESLVSGGSEPLALVIGGGSGIGTALAAAQRGQGIRTVTWDIAGSHDVTCDVTEPAAIDQAVNLTLRRWGMPTCVTVTAGVGHSGLLADAAPEDFDRVMRVNTRGPWLCMRAWAAAMREREVAGSFIAVSSISARLVDRNMGLYCASKAALSMLVQVAAAEWGAAGLRVNAVAPGVTRTPMLGRGPSATVDGSPWLAGVADRTALGRLGEADDIAQAIVALHAMAWVTGQVIECDGGLSLHSPIDSYGEMLRLRAGGDAAE